MALRPTQAKTQLRLFTTFNGTDDQNKQQPSAGKQPSAACVEAGEELAVGSQAYGVLRSLSSQSSFAEEQLLLELAAGLEEHEKLSQLVAPRFPWYKSAYQALIDAPCCGVPGLTAYVAARSRWVQAQVRLAADGDGCRQLVVLGAGFKTGMWKLLQDGVQVYEVDSQDVIKRKKALLNTLHKPTDGPYRKPTFVPVDLFCSKTLLLPNLVAAGFDPGRRSCWVMTGVLPYLPTAAVAELLADISALCAPGSRIIFDFLTSEALEALAAPTASNASSASSKGSSADSAPWDPPGLRTLAAAMANKGSPFKSALRPAFSAIVRFLQPAHFCLTDLLPPAQLAKAASGTGSSKCAVAAGPSAPELPAYFVLAGAVRMNERLLLRDLPGTTTAEEPASVSSLSSWAGSVGSSSCFLQSLWFLLTGWAATAPVPAAQQADSSTAQALPLTLPGGPAPHVLEQCPCGSDPASPSQPALAAAGPGRRQSPEGWTLNTAVDPTADGSSSSNGTTSNSSRTQRAARTSSGDGLDRALSIAPLQHAAAAADEAPEEGDPHEGGTDANNTIWSQLMQY